MSQSILVFLSLVGVVQAGYYNSKNLSFEGCVILVALVLVCSFISYIRKKCKADNSVDEFGESKQTYLPEPTKEPVSHGVITTASMIELPDIYSNVQSKDQAIWRV